LNQKAQIMTALVSLFTGTEKSLMLNEYPRLPRF